MTKKRIAELYRFLSQASMKRMTDNEKVAFIRLLRDMKPVFTEVQNAANDALENAKKDCDDQQRVIMLVDRAMEDLTSQTCNIETHKMSSEMFDHLCLSNDWNFAIIDELESELVSPAKTE